MDAIILAAGEGTRMWPLTQRIPKPLIPLLGKPMIEHLIEAFPSEITRIIMVVRYLGEQFKTHFGSFHQGRPMVYAEGSPLGTAGSFLAAKPLLESNRFLVAYGDDIPSSADVVICLKFHSSIRCLNLPHLPSGFATLRDDGTIASIEEKPDQPKSSIIVNGLMILDRDIFSYEPTIGKGGEKYFSSMLDQYVQQNPTYAVIATDPIYGLSTPEDIPRVEKILKKYGGVQGMPGPSLPVV